MVTNGDPRKRVLLPRKWMWGIGTVAFAALIAGVVTLVSAVQGARIAADRSNDRGNLSQLTLAVLNYYDTYGRFPPPYIVDADGRLMHSWRVLILPFLGEGKLYEEYRFSEPWDGPHNQKLASRMPTVFAFHGSEMAGNTTTNFLAVVGPETVWSDKSKVTLDDVKDGLENTILIVENFGAGIHWMEPRDLSFQNMDFQINSPRGVSCKHLDPAVAPLDGNSKRLGKEITPATLRALLTINGHEALRQVGNIRWLPLADGP
jgi:hypothetical protein